MSSDIDMSGTKIMELQTYKESLIMECNINRENPSPRCRRSMSHGDSITPTNSRRCSLSPENMPPLNHTIELYQEPVVEDDSGSGNAGSGSGSSWAGWETHHVNVSRVPGYGFGIAVSGGRDNPHFANGDPSIAVSDVLKAGPAQDLLQVNDRIMSVNGISLENVEYATAVQVLRDSGNTVSLVVRRRAAPPTPTPLNSPTTIKLTLTKGKKEDFGIVLGCKLFIKELSPKTREQLNSAGQCLNEGDIITRINNTSCSDSMSLKEARKIIESCKERLNIVVIREPRTSLNNSSGFNDQSYQNNFGSDGLNSYSGQNLYVAPPSRSTLIGDNNINIPGNNSINNNVMNNSNSNNITSGRSRGPLPLTQDAPSSPHQHSHPPRPPPPRVEDYYTSRRQLYDEDPLNQRNKPVSDPRLISFQKDGSVGLRLTGGNMAGIFVSAVQPGSPASLQGLCPGDKILKVNDMDMKGVTREEAVLFLLSLQEQIDLIVQHSPEEYQAITAQHKGDSFHIKCHFNYLEATKGEMTFRSGDVFHVVDTLHNGTVGAWQVYRIGRNNQEVQKGIIPNKARAEELATAQFNANKKELTTSESRGSFFRRRRSTHRRSKSLGKEHWDDVVFSDSISKFPAYERVILKHTGFVRPVILFGPIADMAREKLLRDYPDKFTSPQLDNSMEDGKSKNTSGIIRLSGIRAIMDRGKHALLDITPNAVDRLNYAQFYPIVIFLKADNKHIIKQLRQGIPKSAHKSSKKLLEYCQRMDRVWGHIFSQTIGLNEATATTWYPKLTDLIQRCQAQQLWISETKRSEPLSDDFLFPMCSTNESRLSYASSPESDAEAGGVETHTGPRLLRSSSDPSVATAQDNLDRDNLTLNDMVPPPPPYTTGYADSKYGFSSSGGIGSHQNNLGHNQSSSNIPGDTENNSYNRAPIPHSPPQSPQGLYGHVPDLPPRIDRGVKPPGGVLLPGPTPGRNPPTLRHHNQANNRPSAQERLFGNHRTTEVDGPINNGGVINDKQNGNNTNPQGSLDRHRHLNNTNSYDSMSSYDSYQPNGLAATAMAMANARLGPNAPDDLKVGPRNDSNKYDTTPANSPQKRLSGSIDVGPTSNLYNSREMNGNSNYAPGIYGSRDSNLGLNTYNGKENNTPQRPPPVQVRPQLSSSDYSKYSNNRNSTGPVEYVGSIGKAAGAGGPALYKPVPPPKPKHYRPPVSDNQTPPQPHHAKSYSVGNGGIDMVNGRGNHQLSNQNPNLMNSPTSTGPPNGYNYSSPGRGGPWPGGVSHAHSHSHPSSGVAPPYIAAPHAHQQSMHGGNPPQAPPYTGPPTHTRWPPQTTSPHVIDLAGSREQRGSAFELYRKPQHMHNISPVEATKECVDNEANATPKTRKKLSKKSSFLKSITLDLFRSKTSKKVTKHHSLCENDLQKKSAKSYADAENFDFVCADQSLSNTAGKSRGLFRSNSSCDKKPLKPILKRQTSFRENNIENYNTEEFISHGNIRRRQNSMCEFETEPKIGPNLRRQNSLIEYGRRGIYSQQNKHFNMITAIDPIYQRKIEMNHERYYPQNDASRDQTNCLDSSYVSNIIPKPERIYVSSGVKTSNSDRVSYINKGDIIIRQTQCPYSSRQEVINHQNMITNSIDKHQYESQLQSMNLENPYITKQQALKSHDQIESPYSMIKMKENPYGSIIEKQLDSPYSNREDIYKQQMNSTNLYVTRDEVYKQRLASESPYSSKTELLKQRMNIESLYATKTDMLKQRMNIENSYLCKEPSYQTKEDLYVKKLCSEDKFECSLIQNSRLQNNNQIKNYSSCENYNQVCDKLEKCNINDENTNCKLLMHSPMGAINKNIEVRSTENSYVTKTEIHNSIVADDYNTHLASNSQNESICTCETISSSIIEPCYNFARLNESPYVTKQEILSQKAAFLANKEMKNMNISQRDEELEIIKQRNLAKKEKIYQSRREVIENEMSNSVEPIYVSKRNVKDSVIYESQSEMKENASPSKKIIDRNSPYELSDVAHLSRREALYQTKQEAIGTNKIDINFETLRKSQLQTDQEKQTSLALEKTILKGQPLYQSRLPIKASYEPRQRVSNPYNSITSMETHYESECSMQFENKPQSTPYTSQDIKEQAMSVFKCNNKTARLDESDGELQNTTVITGPLLLDTDVLAVGQKGKIGGPDGPCTTWGIFDNEGGVLEDRVWGVSLIIPPDAILPGVKQKIYFTVTDPRLSQSVGGPPIDIDKGEALLSPVVMCGPQGLGFARPVTLRLPHCANTLPSLGLTLNATDTEPAPSWDNILLPATTTMNTVAVKVDHF